MWALRGAQSAAFYYASCTPCLEFKSRRRLQKQHKLDAAAREIALVNARPDEYQQPAPFTTNEFWASEIANRPTPHYALAMEAAKQRSNYDALATQKDGVVLAKPQPVMSRQMINKVSHMELQEVCVSSIGSGAKAVAWAEKADNRWMLKPPAYPGVMNGKDRTGLLSEQITNGSSSRKKSAESSLGRDGSSRTEVEERSVIDFAFAGNKNLDEGTEGDENQTRYATKDIDEDNVEDDDDEDEAEQRYYEESRHKKTYSAYF